METGKLDTGRNSQTAEVPMESNPELELAWQLVEYTGVNVFLTGKAGSGKTTFCAAFVSGLPSGWWY